MPRTAIDPKIRSKTHTMSCRDPEWSALAKIVRDLGFHTPFDFVRHSVKNAADKRVSRHEKIFDAPRRAACRVKPKRDP